jgi:hypothetical protein
LIVNAFTDIQYLMPRLACLAAVKAIRRGPAQRQDDIAREAAHAGFRKARGE